MLHRRVIQHYFVYICRGSEVLALLYEVNSDRRVKDRLLL